MKREAEKEEETRSAKGSKEMREDKPSRKEEDESYKLVGAASPLYAPQLWALDFGKIFILFRAGQPIAKFPNIITE